MDKKQQIINDYLVGGRSFRQLAREHGIGSTTIHRWVMDFQGRSVKIPRDYKIITLPVMKRAKKEPRDVPDDIAALRRELEQERLRNKLLTTMIEIAEEKFKIPIRKKYGTKPSKK
jgi:transposase-like protein